jgi:DNA-directed RNA polymerase subunit RPC12/RpoP
MEFKDKTLKCIDCGVDFIFTAGEQCFFHDKKFKKMPTRCRACKSKRVSTRSGLMPGVTGQVAPPNAGTFGVTFDPALSALQMRAALDALSDFYRGCGGVGLEINWEIEDLRERSDGLRMTAAQARLRA